MDFMNENNGINFFLRFYKNNVILIGQCAKISM